MERLDDLIDRYWDIAYTEGASGKSLGIKAGEVLSSIRSEITTLRAKVAELEKQNAMTLEALDGLLRDKANPIDKQTTQWFWDQARAAVSKATGGAA